MRTVTYKLKRKQSTGEWVVRAFVDGVYNEDMTYYTDDLDDAKATMRMLQAREDRTYEHGDTPPC